MEPQRQGIRIGELLVSNGALTPEQLQTILEQQKISGRPFGDLAERMFDVNPEKVEQAWIEQYMHFDTAINLETQQIDTEVLKVLNRRQAWQFRMLPLRNENGEMVVSTCKERLPRAVNFAWQRFNDPVYFLIAQRPQLEEFLQEHYPWPAMYDMPNMQELTAAS